MPTIKLSEALLVRKDITKEISRLQEKMTASLFYTDIPGEVPYCSKGTEFAHMGSVLELLYTQLEQVTTEINRANLPIVQELTTLKLLDSKISHYLGLRKSFLQKMEPVAWFGKEAPANSLPAIMLNTLEGFIHDFEKERRELDKLIQQHNWNTDVTVQ